MEEEPIDILINHYLNDQIQDGETAELDELIQQCAVPLAERYGCSANAGRVRLYRALNDLRYFHIKMKGEKWVLES